MRHQTGDVNNFASCVKRPATAPIAVAGASSAHARQSQRELAAAIQPSPRTPNFNVAAISVVQLAKLFPRNAPPTGQAQKTNQH